MACRHDDRPSTGAALPFAGAIEGDNSTAVKYERRQRCGGARHQGL